MDKTEFLLILCLLLSMGARLDAQVIRLYSYQDQVLETKSISLVADDRGRIRIQGGSVLLKPGRIDSLKVGQTLYGIIPQKEFLNKNFVPLLYKHPGVWVYSKGRTAGELGPYKERKNSPVAFFSVPGGSPQSLNSFNLKRAFPEISQEAIVPIKKGRVVFELGKRIQQLGYFYLILPPAYVYLSGLGDFSPYALAAFTALPVAFILGGQAMKLRGNKLKKRGLRLVVE